MTTQFKRALLLLPGVVDPKAIKAMINSEEDYIIAVDGGIDKVAMLNITPHIWIGDFDSASAEELEYYHALHKERHPRDKAEVDTELAISYARKRGLNHIFMVGGTGGRLDHQLTLMLMPLQNRDLTFCYSDGIVWMETIDKKTPLDIVTGVEKTVSLLPLEKMEGVSLTGTKWELNDATLLPGSGLSVSNLSIQENIKVSIRAGLGWFCYYP